METIKNPNPKISKELIALALFFMILILFNAIDIASDIKEGSTLKHLSMELGVVLASVFALIYLIRKSFFLSKSIQRQNNEISSLKISQTQLKQDFQKHLEGIGSNIDAQFEIWKLTASEKEIGHLLLKGLSLKEIAEVRGVSERTARTQSLAIYSKSGCSGRAELSAFFLEDLLLPFNQA